MEKMSNRERTLYDFVMNLITDKKLSVNDIVNTIHDTNKYLFRYYKDEPLDENRIAVNIIIDAVKMSLLEV